MQNHASLMHIYRRVQCIAHHHLQKHRQAISPSSSPMNMCSLTLRDNPAHHLCTIAQTAFPLDDHWILPGAWRYGGACARRDDPSPRHPGPLRCGPSSRASRKCAGRPCPRRGPCHAGSICCADALYMDAAQKKRSRTVPVRDLQIDANPPAGALRRQRRSSLLAKRHGNPPLAASPRPARFVRSCRLCRLPHGPGRATSPSGQVSDMGAPSARVPPGFPDVPNTARCNLTISA